MEPGMMERSPDHTMKLELPRIASSAPAWELVSFEPNFWGLLHRIDETRCDEVEAAFHRAVRGRTEAGGGGSGGGDRVNLQGGYLIPTAVLLPRCG